MTFSTDRRLLDFSSESSWEFLSEDTIQVVENSNGTYRPLDAVTHQVDSTSVVQVGITSLIPAPRSWQTGAWAYQKLPFDRGGVGFDSVQTDDAGRRCRLNGVTTCVFPKLSSSWDLELRFPRWLKHLKVSIWRYVGADVDLFGAAIAIATQINQSTSIEILLDVNGSRKGALLHNASNSDLTIDLVSDANLTSDPIIIQSQGYFEVPFGFTGMVIGVWSFSGFGHASIREFV